MMLALGMFVFLDARRCHTRPCSVNQIIIRPAVKFPDW